MLTQSFETQLYPFSNIIMNLASICNTKSSAFPGPKQGNKNIIQNDTKNALYQLSVNWR